MSSVHGANGRGLGFVETLCPSAPACFSFARSQCPPFQSQSQRSRSRTIAWPLQPRGFAILCRARRIHSDACEVQQPENEGLACVKVSVASRGAAWQFFRSLRDFKTSDWTTGWSIGRNHSLFGAKFSDRRVPANFNELGVLRRP